MNANHYPPGKYRVEGKFDGLYLEQSGAGSPPGEWHFDVTVREDHTGVWTDLDGVEVYEFDGEDRADEALASFANAGDLVYRLP